MSNERKRRPKPKAPTPHPGNLTPEALFGYIVNSHQKNNKSALQKLKQLIKIYNADSENTLATLKNLGNYADFCDALTYLKKNNATFFSSGGKDFFEAVFKDSDYKENIINKGNIIRNALIDDDIKALNECMESERGSLQEIFSQYESQHKNEALSTFLHLAIYNSSLETLTCLVNKIQEVGLPIADLINRKNQDAETPIWCLLQNSLAQKRPFSYAEVELFLKYGANPNIYCRGEPLISLLFLGHENSHKIFELLLEWCPSLLDLRFDSQVRVVEDSFVKQKVSKNNNLLTYLSINFLSIDPLKNNEENNKIIDYLAKNYKEMLFEKNSLGCTPMYYWIDAEAMHLLDLESVHEALKEFRSLTKEDQYVGLFINNEGCSCLSSWVVTPIALEKAVNICPGLLLQKKGPDDPTIIFKAMACLEDTAYFNTLVALVEKHYRETGIDSFLISSFQTTPFEDALKSRRMSLKAVKNKNLKNTSKMENFKKIVFPVDIFTLLENYPQYTNIQGTAPLWYLAAYYRDALVLDALLGIETFNWRNTVGGHNLLTLVLSLDENLEMLTLVLNKIKKVSAPLSIKMNYDPEIMRLTGDLTCSFPEEPISIRFFTWNLMDSVYSIENPDHTIELLNQQLELAWTVGEHEWLSKVMVSKDIETFVSLLPREIASNFKHILLPSHISSNSTFFRKVDKQEESLPKKEEVSTPEPLYLFFGKKVIIFPNPEEQFCKINDSLNPKVESFYFLFNKENWHEDAFPAIEKMINEDNLKFMTTIRRLNFVSVRLSLADDEEIVSAHAPWKLHFEGRSRNGLCQLAGQIGQKSCKILIALNELYRPLGFAKHKGIEIIKDKDVILNLPSNCIVESKKEGGISYSKS